MNDKTEQNGRLCDFESWLLISGIVLIAAGLRAPFTAVGPLTEQIRGAFGISNTVMGMITTLPLAAFASCSLLAPALGRKYGIRMVLFASLSMLACGMILRYLPGIGWLFTGTAVIGIAVAMGNVLVPAMIKQEFPCHIGLLTGLYSVSMNVCAALASGISIPLALQLGFGWRIALLVWIVPVIFALLLWIFQLKYNRREVIRSTTAKDAAPSRPVWKSALAWQVAGFMGTQSLVFYSTIAWMSDIFIHNGMHQDTAGWMLSLMQLTGIPCSFIVSILAGKNSNQRSLVGVGLGCMVIGLGGLFSSSTPVMLCCVVLQGIGSGIVFGLAMMFFSLRTKNSMDAARLSGMAQAVGYSFAALGPFLIGFLRDLSGGWNIPIVVLLFTSAVCGFCGLGAARDRKIS